MSSLLGADKEFAYCGSRKEGVYIMGGEVCVPGGGREGTRRQRRQARGATLKRLGAKGTRGERTWNMSIMVVTLEVSKLSGWLKADACCRVEGRACDAGRERWEPGGGRAWGAWWRQHTREACTWMWPDSRLGGQGHARRAHVEHGLHGRDAGGVEAQRLVEGRRDLPSRREGMRCGAGEVEAARRESPWCGGGTQAACTGIRPDSRLGGQGHAGSARRTCSSWS